MEQINLFNTMQFIRSNYLQSAEGWKKGLFVFKLHYGNFCTFVSFKKLHIAGYAQAAVQPEYKHGSLISYS